MDYSGDLDTSWRLRSFAVAHFALNPTNLSIAYEEGVNILAILVDSVPVTYHGTGSLGPTEGSVVYIKITKLTGGAHAKQTCNVRLFDGQYRFDLRFATLPDTTGFIDFLRSCAGLSDRFEFMEASSRKFLSFQPDPLDGKEIESDKPATSIPDSLRYLWSTGAHSDITIVAGGKTFFAHKAILCARSAYFSNAFHPRFIESQRSQIELPESATTVGYILRSLYGVEIPLFSSVLTSFALSQEDEKAAILSSIVELYCAADKYQLLALKNQASEAVSPRLYWLGENTTVMDLASVIYASTSDGDQGVRSVIVQFVQRSFQALAGDPEARRGLLENPALMIDVILAAKIGIADGEDDRENPGGEVFKKRKLGNRRLPWAARSS